MKTAAEFKNIKILVVDNVNYIRKGISLQLNQNNNPIYTISSCSSVEEAIKLVEKGNFDVVITDLIISAEERAGDLIHWLRKNQHDNIKIIINTSHTEALLIYFFLMELEVDAYIYTKDIDESDPNPIMIDDIIEGVFENKYKRFGSKENKPSELKSINKHGQPFCSPKIEETIEEILKEGFLLPAEKKYRSNNKENIAEDDILTEEQERILSDKIEKVIGGHYFTEREEAIMGLFLYEIIGKHQKDELDDINNIKEFLFNRLVREGRGKENQVTLKNQAITKENIGNDLRQIRYKLCLSDYPIHLIAEIGEKMGENVTKYLIQRTENYFGITLL